MRILAQLQRLVVGTEQRQDQHLHLSDEQRHYLYRVLRLRSGDRFLAMDGHGQTWLVRLASDAQAEIIESVITQNELPHPVTLVAALPKGGGFDEVVRQATELGAASIAPVLSDRTLLNPSPQKLDRWRRIAQEAAEQSERQIVPTVHEPVPFSDWLSQTRLVCGSKFICVTRRSCPHLLTALPQSRLATQCLATQCLATQSLAPLLIAIGPEGGWTDTEVEHAIDAGYQPVSLGARILRAVTAPLVALSLVAAASEHPNEC